MTARPTARRRSRQPSTARDRLRYTKTSARDGTGFDTWRTPGWLFGRLHEEFRFDLDAAADEDNALCANCWTEDDNGLRQPWHGNTWCNPPYSHLGAWLRKAAQETREGRCTTAVLLVPARTDTVAWHQWVMRHAAEVRLLRGRVAFDPPPEYTGHSPGSTFPSAVVVFSRWRPGPPVFRGWDPRSESNATLDLDAR